MSPFLSKLVVVAAFSVLTTRAFAADTGTLTLAWDPTDAQGYNLYWGTTSGGPYNRMDDAHHQTTVTLTTLTVGVRYYFVGTAYNTEGVESAYSD